MNGHHDTVTLTVSSEGTVTVERRTWVGRRGHSLVLLTRQKTEREAGLDIAYCERLYGSGDRETEEYLRSIGTTIRTTYTWVRP